jgi:hypothetical protein
MIKSHQRKDSINNAIVVTSAQALDSHRGKAPVVLQHCATQLAAEAFHNKVFKGLGRSGDRKSHGVDIGDAVAQGIGVADARIEYEIRAESVGSGETGTLAQQYQA